MSETELLPQSTVFPGLLRLSFALKRRHLRTFCQRRVSWRYRLRSDVGWCARYPKLNRCFLTHTEEYVRKSRDSNCRFSPGILMVEGIHVRPNYGGRPMYAPVQHRQESPMSQIGTHLVGLLDPCLAALSFPRRRSSFLCCPRRRGLSKTCERRSSLVVKQTDAPRSRFRSHRSFGCALEPS